MPKKKMLIEIQLKIMKISSQIQNRNVLLNFDSKQLRTWFAYLVIQTKRSANSEINMVLSKMITVTLRFSTDVLNRVFL